MNDRKKTQFWMFETSASGTSRMLPWCGMAAERIADCLESQADCLDDPGRSQRSACRQFAADLRILADEVRRLGKAVPE